MAETRRKFDQDFREGAVRLVRETGKPIAQVARAPAPSRPGGPPQELSPPDAEHGRLARRRRPALRCDRHAVNPQASGPDRDRSRRSPGNRELRRRACISNGRHIRTHEGLLLIGAGPDTQTLTQESLSVSKSTQGTGHRFIEAPSPLTLRIHGAAELAGAASIESAPGLGR
jgi:hypothetical protein